MQALALKSINLKFVPEGHKHLMLIGDKWTQVPGCTSISDLFDDDGWKFAWPVKVMANWLLAWWKSFGPIFHPTDEDFEGAIKTAKVQWRKERDDAGNKGTEAHKHIENYVRFGTPLPADTQEEVKHCFNEFKEWEKKYNPVWLATELQVGSETNKFAGILDALCEIDGRAVLLDYKTGKEIKAKFGIQFAGLHLCLKEMGFEVEQMAVLHLPKKLTQPYEYRIIGSDLELDKKAFLAGLEFYRHKNIFMARTK